MSDTVTGVVEHITFRNEDNGYTVLALVSKGKELTVVGSFPAVSEGEYYEVTGTYVTHPVYGQQFKAESIRLREPEGTEAVERYLGSGAIKGIGPTLAARIVKAFGDDTLRIVEEEPERLKEIKGISARMARAVAEQLDEKRSLRRAMIFLQGYGISMQLSVKIYNAYGEGVYDILADDPYRLAEDIDGVGFKTADQIAMRVGIEPDSDQRLRSAVLYTLTLAAGDGNMYLPADVLAQRTAELIGTDAERVEGQLSELALERKIVIRGIKEAPAKAADPENENAAAPEIKACYLYAYYFMELESARLLSELSVAMPVSTKEVEKRIKRLEKKAGVTLEPEQEEAVRLAASNGLVVITGGPGTGKTMIVQQLLSYFREENLSVRLAAPTGRAAKRMTEMTGFEASTVHRLLEVSAAGEDMRGAKFERNEENPLEDDVIIIDEMSMVDIFLMHALLLAVPRGCRLILVGDVDQLPSVGPGAVLRDIIESEAFPAVRLTRIFRQAAQSDIVSNAHRINRGEPMVLDNKSRDFFFLRRSDADTIVAQIVALISKKLPSYVHAPMGDIQVLTPMKKGPLGVERLNRVLQRYLNPPEEGKAEKAYGERIFRVGDKVMQTKNDYDIPWEMRGRYGAAVRTGEGIFNGDLGIIRGVSETGQTLEIEFDEGRFVDYPFTGLNELDHAYAITIHKSQGSEYPAVIIPILSGPPMLLSRNLLYTAVTRAKSCCILMGNESVFSGMVKNVEARRRYTSLKERIHEINESLGGL